MTNPLIAWAAASRAADPLHDRAMVLGYNVGASVSGELGREPDVSFWVRRFDQLSGTEPTFATLDEVTAYLDHVETLPVYCLALVSNPRITVVSDDGPDGKATWITDTETGEVFGVRTFDLEAETRLSIHAESVPTIDNWEPSS